jgi:uncharacterized protein YbcC (UPF0753/DUF2309 family)
MMNSVVIKQTEWSQQKSNLANEIVNAFEKIAPVWPLQDMVAVNPLRGLEGLAFQKAMNLSYQLFQQSNSSLELVAINRETIKWCQAYFDEGQAVLDLPDKNHDFYTCFRQLIIYDKKAHLNKKHNKHFLAQLPTDVDDCILLCLDRLGIASDQREDFFLFLLSTLPGWAGYVQYKRKWRYHFTEHNAASLMHDYVAVRLVLALQLSPRIKEHFCIFISRLQSHSVYYDQTWMQNLEQREMRYRAELLNKLKINQHLTLQDTKKPLAQFVFCIDVRSETMRAAIEEQGRYATYGFAGFFGVPLTMNSLLDHKEYASCPVLLPSKHKAYKKLSETELRYASLSRTWRTLYEALKYMFATPFILVDMMGISSAFNMLSNMISARDFFSKGSSVVGKTVNSNANIQTMIPFSEKCRYAESMLRMTGLTRQFADVVVLCAHEANVTNNAYQALLDCGACGGHSGLPNASVMADILNEQHVRQYLANQAISIPAKTRFISAVHVTTTDSIHLYDADCEVSPEIISQLKNDLIKATQLCRQNRSQLTGNQDSEHIERTVKRKSIDWSEVRPEWGLARNASFIIAPRALTAGMNLHGRSFLHSYDWQQDPTGEWLTSILVAPLIVAQWINAQYFFSTLDNRTYGGGSKITQNIVGQFGVMQGNASDLFAGLPLQSVYESDHRRFHELQRLLAVVYAPKERVKSIFLAQPKLKSLLENQWISLVCIDPTEESISQLTDHLEWSPLFRVEEENACTMA